MKIEMRNENNLSIRLRRDQMTNKRAIFIISMVILKGIVVGALQFYCEGRRKHSYH